MTLGKLSLPETSARGLDNFSIIEKSVLRVT